MLPLPARRALCCTSPANLEQADLLLQALTGTDITPAAIELTAGAAWRQPGSGAAGDEDTEGLRLLVVFEGSEAEVDWSIARLQNVCEGVSLAPRVLEGQFALRCFEQLRDFAGAAAPPLIEAAVLPSQLTRFLAAVQRLDPACSLQAHAGTGAVQIALSGEQPPDAAPRLLAAYQPAASAAGGQLLSLRLPTREGRPVLCGGAKSEALQRILQQVKHVFDPKNLLNPGRFTADT
jgi:FAD/FMN-containing dehydrogenase